MHSTSSRFGPVERNEEPLDELEYMCIAADLLQQMLSELRFLATNNPGLARAIRESDAHARLWTLHETVDLLLRVDDLSMAVPLRRRATTLISWLSDDLDGLTLCATGDNSPVDAFRVGLH